MRRSDSVRIRRDAFLGATPALLARALAEHEAALAAHGFALPRLAEAKRGDEATIDALVAALHGDLPASLVERLRAFDVLATGAGADALVRLDEARRLPRGTHGDEDLALVAIVDAPDLAAEALVHAAPAHEPTRAFTEYRAPRIVSWSDERHRDAPSKAIATRLEERDRTALCKIHRTETADEHVFDIGLGDRPKSRTIVDPKSLTTTGVTDITGQRAYARLSKTSAAIAIRAWPPVVHDVVRRAFGEVLGGDVEFFRAEDLFDLSPFKRLEEALAVEGVPRLKHVEIHAIIVRTPGGVRSAISRARASIVGVDADDAIAAWLANSAVEGVKLYLTIDGRSKAARRRSRRAKGSTSWIWIGRMAMSSRWRGSI